MALHAAISDGRLGIAIEAVHELRYTAPARDELEGLSHIRAASGIAFVGDRLIVVQDDVAFLGERRGDRVDAIALPYAPGGRRRFEAALGNKHEKLDLEACIAIEGELWAFGSGSLRGVRDRICRVAFDGAPVLVEATPLYDALRGAVGGALNLEGVARMGDELWMCHRGNTGPRDPGPAIVRLSLAEVRAVLEGARVAPRPLAVDRYDLGEIAGCRYGFTDAIAHGDRVFYLAAAEASADAIGDGPALGSRLGVICGGAVRDAPLVGPDGLPIKAEALAFDPVHAARAWLAVDPDDPDRPSPLYEASLVGPW